MNRLRIHPTTKITLDSEAPLVTIEKSSDQVAFCIVRRLGATSETVLKVVVHHK